MRGKGVCFLTAVLMLWPLCAWGGSLSLSSAKLGTGEVVQLRYLGPPPAFALVRFNGKTFYMTPESSGAVAVIGVDVDEKPGVYPLRVAVNDVQGQTEFLELKLEVKTVSRPIERLTLPKRMVTPSNPDVLKRIARERELLKEIFGSVDGPFLVQSFMRPVSDVVGSPFGLRRVLNGIPKSPHSGVDFRSARGTTVHAPAKGKVVFAGDLYYTGRTVILDHGEGLLSYYAHLDEVKCREGEICTRAQELGTVGSTGRSTGPHLHWGVKLRGDRIDPLVLLRVLGRERS